MSEKARLGLLLDASGSIYGREAVVLAAANAFLDQLRGDPEHDYSVTLGVFPGNPINDTPVKDLVWESHPLAECKPLTKLPKCVGRTPVRDAVKSLLETLGPGDNTTVMVITDGGADNASTAWTDEQMADAVAARKSQGWQFMFLKV